MPNRNGSVHVATTERRYKNKVYQTHLLRRSYREGGKVKHQTLGNLSHLPVDLIDTIRRSPTRRSRAIARVGCRPGASIACGASEGLRETDRGRPCCGEFSDAAGQLGHLDEEPRSPPGQRRRRVPRPCPSNASSAAGLGVTGSPPVACSQNPRKSIRD